ncbi:phage tail protein [Cronobacter malonaticus]
MQKPNSLRNALIEAVPELNAYPDNLQLSVSRGSIAATLAASLSYEKRYTLTVAVGTFTGELDALLVPVMAWLRINQPDIMTTNEGQKTGFTFEVAIRGDGSVDIHINLLLTERTRVYQEGAALRAQILAEPAPPELLTRPMELYVNGERVSQLKA